MPEEQFSLSDKMNNCGATLWLQSPQQQSQSFQVLARLCHRPAGHTLAGDPREGSSFGRHDASLRNAIQTRQGGATAAEMFMLHNDFDWSWLEENGHHQAADRHKLNRRA